MSESLIRAEGVRWDLSSLYADATSARLDVEAVRGQAHAFAEQYRGRIAGLDAAALAEALARYGELEERRRELENYARLRQAVDTVSAEVRDLRASVDQVVLELNDELRFLRLELRALSDERAAGLFAAPELARERYRLEIDRRERPYTLSELEERALAGRANSACSLWQQLHARQLAGLAIPFDGEDGTGERPHTLGELFSYQFGANRPLAARAQEAAYAGLEPRVEVLAACYDAVVSDRLAIDRLRGREEDPMLVTHRENELEAAIVETMLAEIAAAYPLGRRWFTHKARVLGVERLTLSDQYAPLGESATIPFAQGRELVEEACRTLSPHAAAAATALFAEQRIDAEPRPGKEDGSFCAEISRRVRPYVLTNYSGGLRDVLSLAHELGHELHFGLAQAAQSPLSFRPGIALCEVPSTFAELLLCERLLAQADSGVALGLHARRIEDACAIVFRQTSMTIFERSAYAARAGGQALTVERLSELWLDSQRAFYGDALELPDYYRLGWAYIPHFLSDRFYTYSYAFAHLVALALLARFQRGEAAFSERYLDFLAGGGSGSPAELLASLDIDLHSPALWQESLGQLERFIAAAETASQWTQGVPS